jgi:hypothetical protein
MTIFILVLEYKQKRLWTYSQSVAMNDGEYETAMHSKVVEAALSDLTQRACTMMKSI